MPNDQNIDIELYRLKKEIWEKAIDTQMHFNELSVKSRQLGLSFVVAALGLAIVLLTRQQDFLIEIPFGVYVLRTHVAGIIILVAAAALYAVKLLDLGVYHKMLRGAVTFGQEIENGSLRDEVMQTPLGMTEFVSLFSRHDDVRKKVTENETIYQGYGDTTAEKKINRFYHLTIGTLITIAVILIITFGQIRKDQQDVPVQKITSITNPVK